MARPVVSIPQPGNFAIEWSMPEDVTDRAQAELIAFGFELSGWAVLGERRFLLRSEPSLDSPVLRALAGTPARIIGRDGPGLRVELQSRVRAPGGVPITISCSDLGAPTPVVATNNGTTAGRVVGAVADRITVHDTPRGERALVVELFPNSPLTSIEEKEGWVHVIGPNTHDIGVGIDGWVEASSLQVDPAFDSDSGCDPPDGQSMAPDAVVERPSTVHVGPTPGSPSRIRLRAGAEVRIVERSGDFVAVESTDSGFLPPDGSRFWIATLDVRACGDDASCP